LEIEKVNFSLFLFLLFINLEIVITILLLRPVKNKKAMDGCWNYFWTELHKDSKLYYLKFERYNKYSA